MLDVQEQSQVRVVRLAADSGFEVGIADYGARIAYIRVPAREQSLDVVLRYADANEHVHDQYYLGATLGRYANRIRDGRFRLGGGEIQLTTQAGQGGHCLHGGPAGFSFQRFLLDPSRDETGVTCRYISSHGEEGFPGRLDVVVDYRIVGQSALLIDYTATADRSTIINLANHAYFNLDGNQDTIAGHELTVHASRYTPVDDELIPTGELAAVDGTPLDFRQPVRLGDVLAATDGVDTNFVIDDGEDYIRHAASLYAPQTGVRLEVHTTQTGLQVYTGQHLAAPFRRHAGICLEAQNFPDAPNQPAFPKATLLAGETYRQRTVYEFLVES